jgi:hypothetical protein
VTPTPDLRIYVTAKDIREGQARDPEACLVSRATARAIKRVMKIIPETVTVIENVTAHIHGVGHDEVCTYKCLLHWWVTSGAVSRYIGDFDRGLPVKPASFILKGRNA